MSDGSRAAALAARYRTGPWPGGFPDPVLTFLGGTGCARCLVETPGTTLLVGCGLFAGPDAARRGNFSPGPDEFHAADAVLLPSAALGHAGFLPQLVAEGWHGPVFATPATAALLPAVLSDAATQFAEDADRSPFGVGLPPFRPADVTRAVALLRPVDFGTPHRLDGAEFEFGRAGGRLGAAWVRIRAEGRSVVLAGPLGADDHPLLRAPDPRPRSDVLVLTAPHPPGDGHLAGRFAAAVHRAFRRGGSVVVLASAAGGTELVLTMVRNLVDAGEIPPSPVLLDGGAGLEVFRRAVAEQWPELRRDRRFEEPGSLVAEVPDRPSIIVPGPEPADVGRVLRHLETLLPDPRNGVILLGHPAPGTRAARLGAGARHVKIHGRYHPVRAEVTALGSTGEFADPAELLAWATASPAPETAFVVDGPARPSHALAKALHAEAGWCAVVPEDGERVLW
ncbi:metallo-beta-lactamase family protein [Amycolatopsis lexingtonensis]|uniref:Metallo-beta-lactamase family protein n=1 Tax=Amycolatopsis lexingtonensis TaxID=218822 RepID=A0ABR9HXQ1_9PSEU|nr:MBL fold metallo-hydrolase [Amycolatopsis lexingtonensis]MBE1495683.1 metallo-beta-lactamase family protein [Amycolatopsis lexingtonensis]